MQTRFSDGVRPRRRFGGSGWVAGLNEENVARPRRGFSQICWCLEEVYICLLTKLQPDKVADEWGDVQPCQIANAGLPKSL